MSYFSDEDLKNVLKKGQIERAILALKLLLFYLKEKRQ